MRLRVASACRLLCLLRVVAPATGVWGVEGARAGVESSLRRRGARIFIGALVVLFLGGCASVALNFVSFRACREKPGVNEHDPGTVVGQYLGDDNLTHYRFVADRLKDDDRQVLDVTRVNRLCPLVTGINAATREPIGSVWDLSQRGTP
jgi:hypothetical protein